jgi:uncharacterized protein with GYD domain
MTFAADRCLRLVTLQPHVRVGASSADAFYHASGDTDLFVIVDEPDNVTAAKLSLIVNAAGIATAKVIVLLTADEIDAAAKKTLACWPPG